MKTISLTTRIEAALETCFDLARDIDFHTRSLNDTREIAVGGVMSGLIGLGESVTFRGRHFGLSHEHTSKITHFERPHHFRDEMVRGRFRLFIHDHYFEADRNGAVMKDVIRF